MRQPAGALDHRAEFFGAERFQREHELERQKGTKNGFGFHGGQASLKANYALAHLSDDRDSRMSSPSIFGNTDDPEADPVCLAHSSSFFATDAPS